MALEGRSGAGVPLEGTWGDEPFTLKALVRTKGWLRWTRNVLHRCVFLGVCTTRHGLIQSRMIMTSMIWETWKLLDLKKGFYRGSERGKPRFKKCSNVYKLGELGVPGVTYRAGALAPLRHLQSERLRTGGCRYVQDTGGLGTGERAFKLKLANKLLEISRIMQETGLITAGKLQCSEYMHSAWRAISSIYVGKTGQM